MQNSKKQSYAQSPLIRVEDFDHSTDSKCVKELIEPYLKDLYRDLCLRCDNQKKGIDKVTFIEYCNLSGILNDRLFNLFDSFREAVVSEH